MAVDVEVWKKALGLASNSAVTREQAVQQIFEADQAREKELADLKKQYEELLKQR